MVLTVLRLLALSDLARDVARLALGVVLVLGLILTTSEGWLVSVMATPWGSTWLAAQSPSTRADVPVPQVQGGAGQASPPGVVPVAAIQAPQGPLLGEVQASALMTAIQPWMGVGYVFGGTTRAGVDCSAFVQAVYRQLGVGLPRTAQAQYDATPRVSQLEVGDLLFFAGTYSSPDRITHVGIYVGGGGWMISAAEPAVGRQSLDAPFWRSHFAGAGRVRWPAGNQA